MSRKLLIVNEAVAYNRIINCTNTVELRIYREIRV
jgi:hypothetical protein